MKKQHKKGKNRKKVCFICSSGGHLAEMMPIGRRLATANKENDYFWITFRNPMTRNTLKNERCYLVHDPIRNPLIFIKLMFHSLYLFLKERPNIVITNGAGMAVPFSIIAKLFGRKLVYIESFCRTERPSLSGEVLYPFADKFFVQWEQNLEHFGPKAEYVGSVY